LGRKGAEKDPWIRLPFCLGFILKKYNTPFYVPSFDKPKNDSSDSTRNTNGKKSKGIQGQ
jgi:hypothetical protein